MPPPSSEVGLIDPSGGGSGCASSTERDVARVLDKYDEFFGLSGVPNYFLRSFQAFSFLDHLRISVEFVTGSGWPENATKPKPEDG
jgi:hypothetical protein